MRGSQVKVKNRNIYSLFYRADGRIEVVCAHGIGHTIWYPKSMGKHGSVHGCDLCCCKEDFKLFAKEFLEKNKLVQ